MFSTLEAFSKRYERARGKRDQLRDQYSKTRRTLKQLKGLTIELERALTVAQLVAQQTQEELEYRISGIVTTALQSVFPEPYEFKVHFEIKRGKTEARMVFARDGNEIDPLTASGGGVVDVASFALRLACYLLTNPRPTPCIVLDEPFRFVSTEYQPLVAELLEELSEQLKLQFIIVTHEEELQVGSVIR